MKSFSIIHLSDIHVDTNEDPNIALVREGLVEDIVELKDKFKLDIDAIVVSGDIINKGKSNSFILGKSIIELLMEKLQLDRDKVVFVPGNHDIPRDSEVSTLLDNLSDTKTDDIGFLGKSWKYYKMRFEEYDKFVSDFYKSENCSFGVRDIKGKNAMARFFLLNSAWACTGDADYRNLRIGRWQLEYLKSMNNNEIVPDLSFAVSHHPLSWLADKEKELVEDYLLHDKKLKTDVILHGHIHNSKVNNIITPDGSIMTLVSGIGYPEADKREKGQPKIDKCRYSIYRFDLDNNILDCWLRISNTKGYFTPDTSLYHQAKEDGHFTMKFKNSEPDIKSEVIKPYTETNNIEIDPVPYIEKWIGREDELKRIATEKISLVAISGVGGQGKTAVASQFFRRYALGESRNFDLGVWVDCRELPDSMHSKLIQILDSLSYGKESYLLYKDENLKDTVKRFYKHLRQSKLLIVFDNIDAYVKLDSQEIMGELRDVADILLTNQHESLVILTSRIPINDYRDRFLSFELGGLSEAEGEKFFISRGVELKDSNDIAYCRKIVSLAKGHPWWLGLIAGQLSAGRDTLKNCVEQFSSYNALDNDKIEDYFGSIWEGLSNGKQLEKIGHELLRYLVELPRPAILTELQEIVYEHGPDKVRRAVNRLRSLGLLEAHEDISSREMLYQVHPLVRQFIHRNYTPELQRPFVYKVLCLFLPMSIADKLFNNLSEFEKIDTLENSAKDLIDSIETCLNSRNNVEALHLLSCFYSLLIDKGYHHKFISLGCRLFDAINWKEKDVVNVYKRAKLLSNLIDKLHLFEENEKCNLYISKYEKLVEPNSLPYSAFLDLIAHINWREQKFDEALQFIEEYNKISTCQGNAWDFMGAETTKALILRDKSEAEVAIALEFFNKQKDCSPKFGNMARCYQKTKDYENAFKYLSKSLKMLLNESSHNSRVNLGYAYLWVSECMNSIGNVKGFSAFYFLCKEVWNEYAPTLVSKACNIDSGLIETITKEEAEQVLEEFIKQY